MADLSYEHNIAKEHPARRSYLRWTMPPVFQKYVNNSIAEDVIMNERPSIEIDPNTVRMGPLSNEVLRYLKEDRQADWFIKAGDALIVDRMMLARTGSAIRYFETIYDL